MYEKSIEPVAIMHTGFGEKFGIPRQSGLVPEAAGQIVFEPKYQNSDALRGIEEFTHLWIIWGFSENRVEKFTPPRRSTTSSSRHDLRKVSAIAIITLSPTACP